MTTSATCSRVALSAEPPVEKDYVSVVLVFEPLEAVLPLHSVSGSAAAAVAIAAKASLVHFMVSPHRGAVPLTEASPSGRMLRIPGPSI